MGAITLLENRDDSLSNALRLHAIADRDGKAAAIDYFERFCAPDKLTGHFLATLANWIAEEGDIAAAERLLAGANPEQLADNCTLRFARMRYRLALVSPVDLRLEVIDNITLLPPPHTLSDDTEAGRLKAGALEDAIATLAVFDGRPTPNFMPLVELTRQYLGLVSEDPEARQHAREAVAAYLADPETRVTYVPLAGLFDIDFDADALAAQLEQAARLSGWDDVQLRAAFDLVIHANDVQNIVAFADTHRDRLAAVVGPRLAFGIALEALARSGRVAEARERLAAIEPRVSAADHRFIADVVTDVAGEATPDLHLERYAQSQNDQDLALAVQSLVDARDARLPDEAQRLWRLRRRTADAIVAANALAWFGRERDLNRFLAELGDVALSDFALHSHLAWDRYREGRIAEAEAMVAQLRQTHPDDVSLRQLRINLALEAGEWHGLGDLFKEDLARANARTARQLLQSAGLATAANNPDGKPLLHAAVARASDDPQVYVSAFEIALRRGEDLEDGPLEWFNHALSLSGDDGPVQSRPMRDLIALRDEMIERHTVVSGMMLASEVTIAMAAKPLGTTLAALFFDLFARNAERTDARTRFHMPLFAGNRLKTSLSGAKRIAIEPTALLTLYRLGLLDVAMSAFDTIVLPPNSLPTLFEDLMSGDRGQPSRAARAEALLEHRRANRILVVENEEADGDTIEQLDALAEARGGQILHIPPLYVAGSLAAEVRDPAPFAPRLVSVAGLLAALEARGEMSVAEAERARRFPAIREAWENEVDVDFGTPLILDAVALHYLIDADLLVPLVRLGVPLVVTADVIRRAEGEIEERRTIEAYKADIDRLRAILNTGLRAGRVEIGPAMRERGAGQRSAERTVAPDDEDPSAVTRTNPTDDQGDEDEDDEREEIALYPLNAILRDSGGVDWLVTDDRFVNQHGQFVDGLGHTRGVVTSLDVIDHLADTGAIDAQRRDDAIRALRASGIGLVPVAADEIAAAAAIGDWQHGPARGLRIIRDSLLLPIVRRSILLPLEQHWVARLSSSLALAIKELFVQLPAATAKPAADYLFALLPDLRALAAERGSPEGQLWAENFTVGTLAMLAAPLEVGDDKLEAYHEWFDGAPLERLQGRDADLFPDVVARLKNVVLTYYERIELPDGAQRPSTRDVSRLVLSHLNVRLREELVKDAEVRERIARTRLISLGNAKVEQSAIIAFLTEIAHGRDAKLDDIKGELVADGGTLNSNGHITATKGEKRLGFPQGGLHSPDAAMRETLVDDFLAENVVAPSREAHWLSLAQSGPFSAEDFHALALDGRDNPGRFVQMMIDAMAGEEFEIAALAELPRTYYSSVAETASTDVPLDEMIAELARLREGARHRIAAAAASAPLAIAPGFHIEDFTGTLNDTEAAELARSLIEAGDPFSLVAAFKLLIMRLDDPGCRETADALVEELWGEHGAASALAEDFCTAATVTMVVTRWQGQTRDWPLHGRRLVTLAHAGHICRVFRHFEIKRPELHDQVRTWFAPQMRLLDRLDRRFSRGWTANLLVPDAIEGYLLARFDAILDTLPEEQRPEPWLDTLRKVVTKFGGKDALLLKFPGPLDEFSVTGRRKAVIRDEDIADLIERMSQPPSAGNAELLFKLANLFVPPASDLSALTDAILEQARAADPELRERFHHTILQLADNWALPDLAEGVAGLLPHNKMIPSSLVDEALAIAAAHPEEAFQLIALSANLLAHAQTIEIGENATAFVRALDALINAEPALAKLLHQARMTAALAT